MFRCVLLFVKLPTFLSAPFPLDDLHFTRLAVEMGICSWVTHCAILWYDTKQRHRPVLTSVDVASTQYTDVFQFKAVASLHSVGVVGF